MSQLYRPRSIHAMNRELDKLAPRYAIIHDIDCIYRNPARDFWVAFEWKNPGERMGTSATLRSIQELDIAFSEADNTYKGFFTVRLGFSIDTFPLDDTQQLEVVHTHNGILVEQKTYPDGALSAIQYILDYGRLL